MCDKTNWTKYYWIFRWSGIKQIVEFTRGFSMTSDSVTRLAEKICEAYEDRRNLSGWDKVLAIESLLREAINDAVIEKMMDEDPDFETEAKEIRTKAYTRAAEVARSFDGGTVNHPYDWVAVKEGIAAAIEKLREGL